MNARAAGFLSVRSIPYSLCHHRDEWNAALAALPAAHVLQSWEWGEFKAGYGWTPTRLLWEWDGRPVAAASVLQRRLPWLPVSVMYVPKGPALDYTDAEALAAVLPALEGLARQRRAIFVKIDPDVDWPGDEGAPSDSLAGRVTAALAARGWRPSAEQIQFRHTWLTDLTQSEDELLAGMKAKTRYNVRLAGRKGVVVRPGTVADLPTFYRLYSETSARDRFLIRPFDYYRQAWGTFVEAGLAQLFLAEHEGEPLAGLILFTFGDRAWYMYGASSNQKRRLMPNHLLQWEAMRWAKARGCAVYDWWGAPDVFDQSDPMWGVYRFKAGFGGRVARHIGAWDYPVSPPLYWLYTVAMPRVLGLMRRRHSFQ